MRITTSQLRRIIKEEAQRVLGTRRRAPVRRRRMFEGPDAGPDDFAAPDDDVEKQYMTALKRTYGPGGSPSSMNFAVLKDLEGKLQYDAVAMKQSFFEKTLGTALENCFGWGATPDKRPQDAEYLERLVKHMDRELPQPRPGESAAYNAAHAWAESELDDMNPVMDFFLDMGY